ncbi:MAG TPA: DUF2188 domain-containing protein [Pyrinomonadaceae bacterium]|nr:DUF2188 domain-containing protein [Pyrinomonadaceae bacterium]
MKNLKKFTVSKNKQKGGWDLRQNGTKRLVHHFLTKENAKKGGVVKRLLGKPGGSVHFEKEHGGFDEERTYPRKRDPRRSRG